ncbi:MAG: divalent metal cation transporter, partial [Planctomycetota bacterium]|nr:divalent metal cation transporter [Planctomycetota bacterium]
MSSKKSLFSRVGPGLITVCVVVGPGSIVTSSNVGAQFGFELLWVLLVAVILMLTFMTLGARLGVMADSNPG